MPNNGDTLMFLQFTSHMPSKTDSLFPLFTAHMPSKRDSLFPLYTAHMPSKREAICIDISFKDFHVRNCMLSYYTS